MKKRCLSLGCFFGLMIISCQVLAASEVETFTFLDWCKHQNDPEVPEAGRHTVKQMLKLAPSQKCEEAADFFLNKDELEMVSNEQLNIQLELISDLRPISCLTHLKRLSVGKNKIENFEPLLKCTQLSHFKLKNLIAPQNLVDVLNQHPSVESLGISGLTQISFLSDLDHVTELDLSENEDVNNWAELKKIEALKSLIARNNKLEKVEFLPNKIERLDLSFNTIKEVEFRRFKYLKKLDLSSNPLESVKGLQGLYNLQELYLRDTPVTDTTPLFTSVGLRKINLSGSKIAEPWMGFINLKEAQLNSLPLVSIIALDNCFNLTHLSISLSFEGNTQPRPLNLKQLSDLPWLENLKLSNIAIQDLNVLKDLKHLKEVSVTHSHKIVGEGDSFINYSSSLSDVSALQNISTLRKLNLGSNGIKDSQFIYLKNLEKLEALALNNNPIQGKELAHLNQLKQLKELDLRKTLITKEGLKSLAKLTSLEELSLSSNEHFGIEDIEPLHALKNLKTIRLGQIDGFSMEAPVVKALKKALPELNIRGL